MATRSTICVFDGSQWHGIYCHWDGYPAGVGAALLRLAPDLETALRLVSKGDVSSLAEAQSLGEINYYTERSKWDDNSENETDVDAVVCDTLQECLEYIGKQQYNYHFKDGIWYVQGRVLTEVLAEVKG